MIGMVIVTHGQLAKELKLATEHVVGPQDNLDIVCIGADDDMEHRRDDIRNAVNNVDDGSGVIILTDMFGGTPSNLAISLMKPEKVEVIAGANLPMLIRLAEARETTSLSDAATRAKEAGLRYIAIASEILDGDVS